MLVAACNPSRYALLGVTGWHASCEENLLTALRAMGYEVRVPQPINLFTNIPLGPDGELRWLPALTAPGDYVVFRAEIEVIVRASSCPQDVVPINDRNVTDLALAILSGIGGDYATRGLVLRRGGTVPSKVYGNTTTSPERRQAHVEGHALVQVRRFRRCRT